MTLYLAFNHGPTALLLYLAFTTVLLLYLAFTIALLLYLAFTPALKPKDATSQFIHKIK
jgi:hypothetical protein